MPIDAAANEPRGRPARLRQGLRRVRRSFTRRRKGLRRAGL